MIKLLRFKKKIMANKTITEKISTNCSESLQHFNGFIFHTTFVVCHKKVLIIFLEIKLLLLEYFYCLLVLKNRKPTVCIYESVPHLFYKLRYEQSRMTNSYINLFA